MSRVTNIGIKPCRPLGGSNVINITLDKRANVLSWSKNGFVLITRRFETIAHSSVENEN